MGNSWRFTDTRRLRRRRQTGPCGLASIERNLVHLRLAIGHLLAAVGTERRYSNSELVRLLRGPFYKRSIQIGTDMNLLISAYPCSQTCHSSPGQRAQTFDRL